MLPVIPARPTILIALADLPTRCECCRSFERLGCIVVPAASVNEAITCLSRSWMAYTACLVGLCMPDHPGETLLAIMRNTPRLATIRTVIHRGDAVAGGPLDDRIAGLAGYGAAGCVGVGDGWGVVLGVVVPGWVR
jgi:hypothetical protein